MAVAICCFSSVGVGVSKRRCGPPAGCRELTGIEDC